MQNVLIGIAVVILLFVVVVATRSSTFHIDRSITIAAPPQSAFARVNDFHAWSAWSPYEKKDPQMKRTLEGSPSGAGAIYAWNGNYEVGEGRMTMLKSDEPSQIVIKLEFSKPFTATNTATFSFVPAPGGTKVTWAMDGPKNFVAKAVHLFMDMDKMVGGDFEQGLVSLKAVAERDAKAHVAGAAQAVN